MGTDNWLEMIAEFKAEEKQEDTLPLLDDPDLQKVVLAWRRIRVEPVPPEGLPATSFASNETWYWLWEGQRNYVLDLVLCSGFPTNHISKVERLFRQAKTLRLIYPDGTISSLAARIMGELTAQRINRVRADIVVSTDKITKSTKKRQGDDEKKGEG